MSGIVGGAGSKSGVIGTTELDYEEGTWIPTADMGSLTIDGTAPYTKVGRLVTIRAYVYNFSDSSGSVWGLAGLPYLPQESFHGSGVVYTVNVDSTAVGVTPRAFESGTGLVQLLTSRDNDTWIPLTYSNVGAGHVAFTLTYMTAS